MLTHKSNKAVYIHTALFLCDDAATNLRNASFQRFLFRLIVFGHLGKTLVRYPALNIILVKPLNDGVEFVYPCLCQLQLSFFIPERFFGFRFG